jgi:uncharacterized membrane protein
MLVEHVGDVRRLNGDLSFSVSIDATGLQCFIVASDPTDKRRKPIFVPLGGRTAIEDFVALARRLSEAADKLEMQWATISTEGYG